MIVAAISGYTEIVWVLLKDPRGAATIDAADELGTTALCWACRQGHTEITRALLKHGADASITNTAGETPLGVATAEGHQGCVEALQVSAGSRSWS